MSRTKKNRELSSQQSTYQIDTRMIFTAVIQFSDSYRDELPRCPKNARISLHMRGGASSGGGAILQQVGCLKPLRNRN